MAELDASLAETTNDSARPGEQRRRMISQLARSTRTLPQNLIL